MKTAFALAVMVEDLSIALLPISGCSLKPPGMSSTDPRTTSCKSISAPDSFLARSPQLNRLAGKTISDLILIGATSAPSLSCDSQAHQTVSMVSLGSRRKACLCVAVDRRPKVIFDQ